MGGYILTSYAFDRPQGATVLPPLLCNGTHLNFLPLSLPVANQACPRSTAASFCDTKMSGTAIAAVPAQAAAADPTRPQRQRRLSLPQWKLPKSISLYPYLHSRKARVAVQKAAKGTQSGPTGQEVDAWVASTLTRKQGVQAVANAAATAAVAEPNEEAPKDKSGAVEEEEEAAAAFMSCSHADTDVALAELLTDEKGRRLGLEDKEDPLLKDDPAVFAVVPKAVPAATSPSSGALEATADQISLDLLEKVKKATNGRQTTIRTIAPPSVTDVTEVIAPEAGNGFVDPRIYGGTSFDLVGDGEHEPLNVIISSLSSPEILTKAGFQSYARSLDFDRECLGLHAGTPQKAWTDPRGWRDQEWLFRMVYTPFDHVFGTCLESLLGGNHFRAWQQQGTGAWFLATSREKNATTNHDLVNDGYNVGRDELVQQSQSQENTETSFFGKRYRTKVEYIAGLMPQGNQGVNHDIAVDGLTAVLTVTVVSSSSTAVEATSAKVAAAVEDDADAAKPVSAETVAPSSSATKAADWHRSGINEKTKELWRKLRHKSTAEAKAVDGAPVVQ
ncbi:hypothetical protein ACQY0O_001583 [Thecaphora frezii]